MISFVVEFLYENFLLKLFIFMYEIFINNYFFVLPTNIDVIYKIFS